MAECSICQYDGAALETQRDIALHAASLVENPEYVATLQRAGVEYAEQLVARIERLTDALERIVIGGDVAERQSGDTTWQTEVAREALRPSTNEGSEG